MTTRVLDGRDGALYLRVRLTPKASRNAILGIMEMPDGKHRLKIAVNALPEDGAANAELIYFLSKTLKLPKNAIEIASGQGAREKLLRLSGDITAITARLASQLEDLK